MKSTWKETPPRTKVFDDFVHEINRRNWDMMCAKYPEMDPEDMPWDDPELEEVPTFEEWMDWLNGAQVS